MRSPSRRTASSFESEMGVAARRLRARRARRLVARFALWGCALALGAVAGWAGGLTASATIATLCIGLSTAALILHLAAWVQGHRRKEGVSERRPIRHTRDRRRSLVRGALSHATDTRRDRADGGKPRRGPCLGQGEPRGGPSSPDRDGRCREYPGGDAEDAGRRPGRLRAGRLQSDDSAAPRHQCTDPRPLASRQLAR
jgi:hypothetical protein